MVRYIRKFAIMSSTHWEADGLLLNYLHSHSPMKVNSWHAGCWTTGGRSFSSQTCCWVIAMIYIENAWRKEICLFVANVQRGWGGEVFNWPLKLLTNRNWTSSTKEEGKSLFLSCGKVQWDSLLAVFWAATGQRCKTVPSPYPGYCSHSSGRAVSGSIPSIFEWQEWIYSKVCSLCSSHRFSLYLPYRGDLSVINFRSTHSSQTSPANIVGKIDLPFPTSSIWIMCSRVR